jgi:putative drug exporter of the RND superfamily
MEIAVFGSASAIYCRGLLGDGGVLHTFKGDYGLFWLMPILAFSLMTGLGLDYDVFIIESICHERDNGWEVGDAISVGVQRSGPIISWAGAIMSVAYGGYLFADIPLLNQLGMFIVFSVVLDTFIVRPLLVPAIMHILGPANFWPRRCPPVTKPPLVDECVPELELDPAWEEPQVNDVESRSSNDSHVEASSM